MGCCKSAPEPEPEPEPEPDEGFDESIGKYFVKNKATWKNCKEWIDNENHILKERRFGRTKSQLNKYKEHKNTILSKYVSVGDYILKWVLKHKM